MNAIAANSIKLTVLFFSVLREKLGRASMEVTLEPGSTGSDLLDKLSLYSAEYNEVVGAYRPVIRLAVNAGYVRDTIELNHGDEVALITPVSGG